MNSSSSSIALYKKYSHPFVYYNSIKSQYLFRIPYLARHYSSNQMIHQIIITDPSFVTSRLNYKEMVSKNMEFVSNYIKKEDGLKDFKSLETCPVQNFIKVSITDALHTSMNNGSEESNYEMASKVCDESFFLFGEPIQEDEQIEFLGCHGSDSGMTSIIEDEPFESDHHYKKDNTQSLSTKTQQHHGQDLEVDWEDFALTALSSPEVQVNREEFPLYLFFSRISEEDSVCAIFGQRDHHSQHKIYKNLILRSRESALINNKF